MRHILPRGPIPTNYKDQQEDTPRPEKKDDILDVVSKHETPQSFPAEKPFFFKRILVNRVICRIEVCKQSNLSHRS
jgi:hypothetical protein